MRGFIFLCSDQTEAECFSRMLCGGGEGYQYITGKIQVGDPVFLYNYQSKKLHGIFKAVSQSASNIEEDAWSRRFPWQVKIAWDAKYEPLSKVDFESIISFNSSRVFRSSLLHPEARLSEHQLKTLIDIFKSPVRMPHEEGDFRTEFPTEHLTYDGHKARSHAEVLIDDWMFHHGVRHAYELKVPIAETMFCDFFIPYPQSMKGVFVEYWGMEENEKYRKRMEYKISLYKKYNLDLIELFNSDLKHLNDVFQKKLRVFFPDIQLY